MNLSALNDRQQAAVKYIDTPLLVLAGAGSGKTSVITHKIAYLIDVCGIKATNIAAITFTNKAAREMKKRTASLVDKSKSRGLKISTFHTLGLNILKAEHSAAGLRPGFSIYDSHDVGSVLKEIIVNDVTSDSEQVQQLQWKISNWKNALISPQQAKSIAEERLDVVCASLYEKYQASMRAYNAIDFDDLIYLPVELFTTRADILEKWQHKIHYLLIDEYQDTNGSQYTLIKQLLGKRNSLTVVGDDDQSIYAWRGAQPENLALLQSDYPQLHVIKLEQNYRSMGRILKAANSLIENNQHVFEKKLWSNKGYGDPIKVMKCRNDQHEAQQLISEIMSHRFKTGSSYSDYAVLFRGNHQSRIIEKTMREQRVPYYLSGGTSFFEKAEVKDILAYIRLLANEDDDAAFLRIINTPRREIGAATLGKLGEYAQNRGCSLFRACNEMGLQQVLPTRALESLQKFHSWYCGIHERLDQQSLMITIRDLIHEIRYETWLIDTCKDQNTAEKRMESVNELLSWIEKISADIDKESQLNEVVNYMTLMNILERQEQENEMDSVNLLTLHAAKGLEFPNVFIIGMEEEILPHKTSVDEGNIEEERRLAYVGITRAQENLTMSYSRIRKRYGEKVECEYSRFIDELPGDDLLWIGGKDAAIDPEEQKQRGNAHLANLKELLADEAS